MHNPYIATQLWEAERAVREAYDLGYKVGCGVKPGASFTPSGRKPMGTWRRCSTAASRQPITSPHLRPLPPRSPIRCRNRENTKTRVKHFLSSRKSTGRFC